MGSLKSTTREGKDLRHKLLENELSFIINLIDLTETDETETKDDGSIKNTKGKNKTASDHIMVTLRPLHGDIRKTLKTHFRNNQTATWAIRLTRGQLIRDYPTQTLNLIQQLWTSPTSATIQFLIETLNQVDPKNFDEDTPKTTHCTNCSRNQPASTRERERERDITGDLTSTTEMTRIRCLHSAKEA